ncbi:2Fe-2S iron-sulfur cluster-binding protein [Rhodococcus opacus]|uniref:2Fe-2S iron-sulfur cluster-binding protein n=1 Tax=Rhodococcus opacus TaxID=37919 RepID=UPI001C44E4BD|nr:2Fe-2S iron-sulfur cluster-binding protein [Rhodococcus opacus]MBV6756692.1 2Fe-2S iron-sulfur cluster binding domain-containing protein [Rhodococcus opacus]
MPKIVYLTPSGESHTVEVPEGKSIMEGSLQHNVPGIFADCGGNLSCATCHVYVEDPHAEKFEEMTDDERDMLEFAEGVQATSRLSCQLVVTSSCEGVAVSVAATNE